MDGCSWTAGITIGGITEWWENIMLILRIPESEEDKTGGKIEYDTAFTDQIFEAVLVECILT